MLDHFAEGLVVGLQKNGSFASLIHHPLVQAIGYGALAAEGAHAIVGGRYLPGKLLQAKGEHWAHETPYGRAFGLGSLGLSTAFLGAEGLVALLDLMKKKQTKAVVHHDPVHNKIHLKVELPAEQLPMRMPRLPIMFSSKMKG